MPEADDTRHALDSAPLERLGTSARLYRALRKMRVSTLGEAMSLDEREIERNLIGGALREYDRLFNLYEHNPGKLLEELGETEERPAVSRPAPHPVPSVGKRPRQRAVPPGNVPNGELGRILLYQQQFGEFERRAGLALEELDDHREEALVAECFGGLSAYMDETEGHFADYFRRRHRKGDVEEFAASFPSTFLVLVSHLASREFDGGGLWENLFGELGIESQGVQRAFKRLFVGLVEKRRLPTFTDDGVAVPYFYTALFHGGLSQSLWESLWKNSAFKYADEMLAAGRVSPTRSDAYRFLVEARDDDGFFYARNKVTDNILEKASDAVLVPLMLSVLEVAIQVRLNGKDLAPRASGYEMLSDNGLPEVAMKALRAVLEQRQAGSPRKSRVVYLPKADAHLDLDTGDIVLMWPAQRFPAEFKGREISYVVNGKPLRTQKFKVGIGDCVLEEAEVPVRAAEHIEAVLQLREADAGPEDDPLSEVTQVFKRSKPGVYEFVRDNDGSFRIRRQNSRIRKRTEVAYLVSGKFGISPGPGMRLLESLGVGDEGRDLKVEVYEVEPGASGTVFDRASKEEVATWQEGFNVEIGRDHVLGRTTGGRDLYGRIQGADDANPALPAIVIHSFDAESLRSEIDVVCKCDGKRVHILAKPIGEEDPRSASGGAVLIAPYEAVTVPWFVDDGEISAVSKETGQTVMSYRFSVLPIGSYSLSSLRRDRDGLVGGYRFQTWLDVVIDDFGVRRAVHAHGSYGFELPLEAPGKPLKFTYPAKRLSVSAVLNAAGLAVRVDERLLAVSEERKVTILDAGEVSGRVEVSASSKRHGRGVFARLGTTPLFYKELDGPGAFSFDVFSDSSVFEWGGGDPHDLPVEFVVSFGGTSSVAGLKPASASVRLLRCETGFGLGSWRVVVSGGGWALRFDNPAREELGAVFRNRTGRELGRSTLAEGERFMFLPAAVGRRLASKKYCRAEISPCDLFGDIDEEKTMTIDLTNWSHR